MSDSSAPIRRSSISDSIPSTSISLAFSAAVEITFSTTSIKSFDFSDLALFSRSILEFTFPKRYFTVPRKSSGTLAVDVVSVEVVSVEAGSVEAVSVEAVSIEDASGAVSIEDASVAEESMAEVSVAKVSV